MPWTLDAHVLLVFVVITNVIYASLAISGKTIGIVGMKWQTTSSFYVLLLPTHCFYEKERGPIERNVASHPYYPHCFSFLTKKEREDIGKQHENTPRGFNRCPGHPTASTLFVDNPHWLGPAEAMMKPYPVTTSP